MGFLNILGSKNDSNERPPKPEPETRQEVLKRTRYLATVEYRNGDIEEFECYGIYSRGERCVKFNTNPYGRADWYEREISYTYDRRKIHYETLSREPQLEEIATDRFVITGDVEWEWDKENPMRVYGDLDWRADVQNVSLEVVQDIGGE